MPAPANLNRPYRQSQELPPNLRTLMPIICSPKIKLLFTIVLYEKSCNLSSAKAHKNKQKSG